MEDLRDLLDIQNDDAHCVLADCEDEMAVYNAIPVLPVVFLRYRP